MESDCIFCKIASENVPVEKIYENEDFFSILDANPVTKGHSLVISKKHFTTTLDLPVEVGEKLLDCIKNTANIIMKKEKSNGFNVVNNNFEVAGQVVKHVHYHIIPRHQDDGIRFCVKKVEGEEYRE